MALNLARHRCVSGLRGVWIATFAPPNCLRVRQEACLTRPHVAIPRTKNRRSAVMRTLLRTVDICERVARTVVPTSLRTAKSEASSLSPPCLATSLADPSIIPASRKIGRKPRTTVTASSLPFKTSTPTLEMVHQSTRAWFSATHHLLQAPSTPSTTIKLSRRTLALTTSPTLTSVVLDFLPPTTIYNQSLPTRLRYVRSATQHTSSDPIVDPFRSRLTTILIISHHTRRPR